MTGATSGIGLASLKALVAGGWACIAIGRSRIRMDAADRAVRTQTPDACVHWLEADLSAVSSIRVLSARIRARLENGFPEASMTDTICSDDEGPQMPALFPVRWDRAAMPGAPASGSVVPGSIYDKSGQGDAVATSSAAAVATFPPGFDDIAFSRQAKVNFIRMQAANDAGNLDDLREFTTPEMYAELKMDIDERQGKTQTTEVMTINAETLEALEEGNRQIVSVRFYGTLREDSDETTTFDEVWHMTKPLTGNQGWVVAGIQQNS